MQNKLPLEKNESNNEEENNVTNPSNVNKPKHSKVKSTEKMSIKVDDNIEQEILKDEKKPKIKIFNNKKNNEICSELLKSTMKKEKELIIIPYAKEKQKINKTLNTIGNAHGISYPTCSVIKGVLTKDKNYLAIIRDDDKKGNKKRKSKNMTNIKKKSKAKINLDNNIDNNNLKEMLTNEENIQDYI